MPFRWKKNTRFSQLVADHLQSPKHGGSLVVETGFPTSLIDLYVRNRGRFRKSKQRPKGKDSSIPLSDSSDSFVDLNNLWSCDSDRTGIDEIIDGSSRSEVEITKLSSVSYTDSNSCDSDRTGIEEIIDDSSKTEVEIAKFSSVSFVDSNKCSFGDSDRTGIDEIIDNSSKTEVEIAKFSSFKDSNNCSFGDSDRTGVAEIIEEDVVVVVGGGGGSNGGGSNVEMDDSSRRENVEMAKLNPVIVAALKVLFVMVLILGTKRFKFGITVSAFVLFFLELVGKPLLERSSLIRFRPSVDPKPLFESKGNKNIKDSKENNTTLFVCNQVVEIEEQVEEDSKEKVRSSSSSEKELDESRSEVLMEIRHKSSRRALMKSRMKKLVPKKLRKSSMGSKGEISIGSSECSESKLEMMSVSKQKQSKIVKIEIEGPCSSMKVDCGKKKLGKESEANYGGLVLCLIVLIGLIGGRVWALVLALSWCLIQKKSPTTMEKNVKFLIS